MTKAATCSNNTSYGGNSSHVMGTTIPNNHNSSNGVMNGANASNSKSGNGGTFKPVPPPKPKNYRPALQNNCNSTALKSSQIWEYTVSIFILHGKNILYFEQK